MSRNNPYICRLNPVVLLLFILPILFLSISEYKKIMTYLEPLVEYRVDGGVEVCTSEYTCKGYPKEVLSDPKSIPESVGPVIESMRTNFVTDVDLATWYKRTQLNNLISNTTVLVILISIFTHTFFYRRIVLMDNLIILRKNTH